MSKDNWQVFQLSQLLDQVKPGEVMFDEFLHTPSLSCSVYHVPAGSKEMQRAHVEDELYYVLKGAGMLRIEGDEHIVQSGTLLYVRADCDHTFFEVTEDLTVLAFFGSAR
ncbi:MAG: cupin domain-containing protein [Pseudomonadota bacterium]